MSTQPHELVKNVLAQFDGIKTGVEEAGPGHKGKFVNIAVEEQLIRLLASGMRMNDAVKAVGLAGGLQRASMIMRRPEALAKLKELNAQVYAEIDAELKFRAKATHEKLHQAADEALDKVIDLMRGADSEMIQFRAAQDLMDRRQDTSKVHRVDKRSVNVNIDSKWLEAAALAEAESAPDPKDPVVSPGPPTIEGGSLG